MIIGLIGGFVLVITFAIYLWANYEIFDNEKAAFEWGMMTGALLCLLTFATDAFLDKLLWP